MWGGSTMMVATAGSRGATAGNKMQRMVAPTSSVADEMTIRSSGRFFWTWPRNSFAAFRIDGAAIASSDTTRLS